MSPTATAPAPTTSAQALQGLQQFQQQMKSPQDIISGAAQTSGVDQQQQQVQGLQQAIQNTTGLLNRVAPDVMGRTENSLVTQAQADRIIANEQNPLQSQLTQQTQGEQTAAQQLAADQTKADALANAQLTGQQSQLGNLQNIYQDLLGKEQAAQAQANLEAQQAEAKRQFDAQLAAQQAAAARSGSGSASIPQGPGPTKAPATPTNPVQYYNSQSRDAWIQAIHQNYHGQSWGAIANAIQKASGLTIPTGSNLDQALHYIFTGIY